MDPIKPLDSVGQLLRLRMAADARRSEGKVASSKASATQSAYTRPPVSVLRRRIKSALSEVDVTKPGQGDKAMRVFIEHVLAWEFGDQILNDPRFAALTDDVQQVLGNDVEELLRAIDGDRS